MSYRNTNKIVFLYFLKKVLNTLQNKKRYASTITMTPEKTVPKELNPCTKNWGGKIAHATEGNVTTKNNISITFNLNILL